MASAPWDAITPVAFHFPRSVTPFPLPGLDYREEIAEPFKDDETPPHKFISYRHRGMSLDSTVVSG